MSEKKKKAPSAAEEAPTNSDAGAAPSQDLTSLWLVDRSRIQRGRIGCRRERYREYHSGPTGYGIRRRAQNLPLATGTSVHELIAGLMGHVLASGSLPPDDEARRIISKEVISYKALCEARGFLHLEDADPATQAEVLRVVEEQGALIEAFGWALQLAWLPALLKDWDPVLVEKEMLLPVDEALHLMSRADMVLRRKVDGALAQFEAKTVGGYLNSPMWRRQWEDSVQLMLTKLAIEHHLGEPVTQAYIFALDKSSRTVEKASGLFKQWSFFLYAYHREAKAANPPMVKTDVEEDWQLRWNWFDEQGGKHTLGKAYKRETVFTYPFENKPKGMSSTEFWMRSIPVEEIMTQHEILGPFDFLTHSQDSVLTGLRKEEEENRARLWEVYQAGEASGWNEADPQFIHALDEAFPQSWNCHAYGKDCQFLPICRREPLWAAPHDDERFETRRPHHEPELKQMVARGIKPPLLQDEDDGGVA